MEEKKLKNKIIKKIKYREKESKKQLIISITILMIGIFALSGYKRMNKKLDKLTMKTEDSIKITIGGDISEIKNNKHKKIYKDTKAIWSDSEISIFNISNPIIDVIDYEEEITDRYIGIDNLKELKSSGAEIISYSNDNIFSMGLSEFYNSISILENIEMKFIGSGMNIEESVEPYIFNDGNRVVKIYSVSSQTNKLYAPAVGIPGVNTLNETIMEDFIFDSMEKNFKKDSLNIVYVDQGPDNYFRVNTETKKTFRKFVDLGADIVVGVNNTILQPIELYEDGIIFYNIGDFVNDNIDGKSRQAAIINIYYGKDIQLEVIPLERVDGIPYITNNEITKKEIRRTLTKNLESFNFKLENDSIIIRNGK